MQIDYRRFFVALIASILIAIPVAAVFKNHSQQLESVNGDKQRLQLDVQKKQSELEKLKIESTEKSDQNQKLKQQNEQLQKDLQAKRERQANEARLAAARQAAPVSRPSGTFSAAAGGGNCEVYRGLVAQYDWNVSTMMRIMNAESGCNPTNHNFGDNHRSCLGSFGLMQIGCVHGYNVAYLSNPANNIAAAYKIFKSQGYTAWTTF